MIFWLAVIMLIVGAIIAIKSNDWVDTGFNIGLLGFALTLILAVSIIVTYSTSGTRQKVLQNNQAAIEYKIDSGIYSDKMNLLDKDIITEVKNWNAELIMKKDYQRNFWIGIFIPNIYDELEIIEYSRIK